MYNIARNIGAVLVSQILLISAEFAPDNIPEYFQFNIWTKEAAGLSQSQWSEDSVDKCFIYIARLPDDAWVILDNRYIPGANNETIKEVFYRSDCLEECRKRDWCKSADFSEGYDRCHLQSQWGTDKLLVHAEEYVHYIEKPQCYANSTAGPGSADYLRLGYRLVVSGYTSEALTAFDKGLAINPFSPMMYLGKALSQILMGESVAALATMQVYNNDYVLTGKNYVNITEREQMFYDFYRDNLIQSPSNAAIAIANYQKNLYEIDPAGSKTQLPGITAALLYKQAGDTDNFEEMLDALLQENSGDKVALRLKLMYLADEKPTELKTMVSSLVSMVEELLENNDDPRAWLLATRIMQLIGRNQDAVSYGRTALGKVVVAATQGYPDTQIFNTERYVWFYIHRALLNRADLTAASNVIQNVTRQIPLASTTHTMSAWRTLENAMRWRQYFAYWFTGADDTSLPSDPDVVQDIQNSTLEQRSHQLMLQMAIVFNNLRETGKEGSGYQTVFNRLETFINNNPADSTGTITAAMVNKLLFQTVYAIKNTDNLLDLRTQLLGTNGYLRQAKDLYDSLSYVRKSWVILNPYEVMVDIIQRLSKSLAGPILISGTEQDLRSIQAGLKDSTFFSPSINTSIAWVQYALGNNAEAQSTLIRLKDSLIPEALSWLEENIAVVSKVSLTGVELGVGRRLGNRTDTIKFANDDEKQLYDNLNKGDGLRWTADTSLYDECTSALLKSQGTDNPIQWPPTDDVSVSSSMMQYYAAASVNICKLRCLYETSFECVSFTYGYGRCLLHNEKKTSDNELIDLRDETYYQKPTCDFGDGVSNGYSQMMLGVKALSNGLVKLAQVAFDKAIEYDPEATMPHVLKALSLSADQCTKTQATEAIGRFTYRMTDQEESWYTVVNSIVSGSINQNALEKLKQDFTGDSLAKSLYNELTPDANIEDPENAWDIITYLTKKFIGLGMTKSADIDWTDMDNKIADLQSLSPYSPVAGYLKMWVAAKRGLWETLRQEADSAMKRIDDYFSEDSRPSNIENIILQLKHHSFMQEGKYSEAQQMYLNTQENNKELANLLFGLQVYTDRINGGEMQMLQNSALSSNGVSCTNIFNNKVVAQIMNSVQRYVKTSDVAQAKTDADVFLNGRVNAQMWKYVSDLFYAMHTGQRNEQSFAAFIATSADNAQLAPIAFPTRSYSSTLRLAQPGLRLPIVVIPELKVWYSTVVGLIDTVIKRDEAVRELDAQIESWPKRIVPLWLRFKVYYDWAFRERSEANNNLTAAAARDALAVWTNADAGTYQRTILQSFIANPTVTMSSTLSTENKGTTEPIKAPEEFPWWVIVLVGVLVFIIILSIVIAAGCHANKKATRDKEKQSLYSGSIHSARSGHRVRADHGDIVYGRGHDDEGMVENHEMTHDFST